MMISNNPIELLITLPFSSKLTDKLVELSPRLVVRSHPASTPEEVPLDVWPVAEILYTDQVLPSPEQAPNLQWIQFHWAGIDHAANLPLLKRPGLITTTMSGASATQMAEYIIMMMLALGRRLPLLLDLQQQAEWPKDRWERLNPIELRDSTVGIVGYGSIGRQLAHLLFSFGAKVLATKRDARHLSDDGYAVQGFGDPQGDYVHRLYPVEAI